MPPTERHLTFLVTKQGKPLSAAGFGNWFRDRCDEAGARILGGYDSLDDRAHYDCTVDGIRKCYTRDPDRVVGREMFLRRHRRDLDLRGSSIVSNRRKRFEYFG